MEKKIISFKTATYEKLYRDFYKKPENRNFTLRCFYHEDKVFKSKIS